MASKRFKKHQSEYHGDTGPRENAPESLPEPPEEPLQQSYKASDKANSQARPAFAGTKGHRKNNNHNQFVKKSEPETEIANG